MRRLSIFLLLGAISLVCVGTAKAIPFDYCANGFNGPGTSPNLGPFTLNDFLTRGCISGLHQGGITPDSDGFYSNAGGGDPVGKVEQSILFAQGLNVVLTSQSDNVSGAGSSGTWTSSTPVNYLTIKAANGYALYFLGNAGVTSGSWTTAGLLTNGGTQPDISHLDVWSGTSSVPEPTHYALVLFLGMIGLLFVRQRAHKA